MTYPYSWTPISVTPYLAEQVTVWDSTGNPASLAVPVSVSNGTLTFSLTNPGKYRISVRNGKELETGTFNVDVTGVDVSTPEFTTYSFTDTLTDTGQGIVAAISDYIRLQDLQNQSSLAFARLGGMYVSKWQPTTSYTAGQPVLSPAGDTVTAKTDHISGPTYLSSNWNLSSSYAAKSVETSKENAITAGTTGQYWRGDKTFQTLDKAAVGLTNVDNTSDTSKPVSTAQSTAIALKLDASQKGAASGVATLDSGTKVPSAQIPDLSGTYAPITAGGKGVVRKDELIFNVMDYGAVGDGTTDDTTAIQALFNSVPQNSTILLPKTHKISTYVTINTPYVTVKGPGTVRGGKLRIGTTGTRQDLFITIDGVTFDGQAAYASGVRASGVYGIELLKARAVTIKGCVFVNQDKAIYVNPLSDAVAHDTGMISITDNRFSGVNYALYVDRDDAATWMHFSDSLFKDNVVNVAHITHVWIKSADGIHIKGNIFFFPSYNSTDSFALQAKKQNIYIGQFNFGVIAHNNLFEAGEESILIDQASRFIISDNNIAWPGQKQPSDAIKMTGNNTMNGVISGNMVSKMTKDGISIYANSTGTVSIKDNSIEYDSATNTYYGTPALSTFTHYGIYQDAASVNVNMFEMGNDMTGGLYTNRKGSLITSVRLNNDTSMSASKTNVTFTAATAAPIFTLNSQRFGQLTFSGLIQIEVKPSDTENTNLSVYLFQVSKGPLGYYITKVSEQGLLTGGSANWPSFTFTIDDTTGKLVATPVGSTAGTFYFYTTAMGNIRALSA